MKARKFLILSTILLVGFALSFQGATAQGRDFRYGGPRLYYELTVKKGTWDRFFVSIQIENNPRERLVFAMPAWMPGAYVLMHFGKHVQNFRAFDGKGNPLRANPLDQQTWEVQAGKSALVKVSYEVKVSPRGFMGRALTEKHAQVNGPAVFMYVKGWEDLPVTVRYRYPKGWRLATGLEATETPGVFTAPNYDVLVDAPAAIGTFRQYEFEVGGVPHYVVVDGEGEFDTEAFLDCIQRIVRYQTTELFGDIPYRKYVFIYRLYPGRRGGGGLEHRNSTVIGLSAVRMKEDATSAASVTAHEFFHLWNVKRIRPRGLGPFDYTRDARTTALWFCEGVTSYYANLTLVRTGIWSEEKFLESQARQIAMLQSTPERLETSVAMASWNTWERGYGVEGLSYYNKGQLLGLLLDLSIRHVTDNRRSLDDVLRFLNRWFAKFDEPYDERDLLRAVNGITNADFTEFFDKYVYGTVELPYEKVLGYAGIAVTLSKKRVPYIGRIAVLGRKNRIFGVSEESPLGQAGVRNRDFLLAVDGQKITGSEDIRRIVRGKKEGEALTVEVERAGRVLTFEVTVEGRDEYECELTPIPNPTEKQRRIREGWLKGITD